MDKGGGKGGRLLPVSVPDPKPTPAQDHFQFPVRYTESNIRAGWILLGGLRKVSHAHNMSTRLACSLRWAVLPVAQAPSSLLQGPGCTAPCLSSLAPPSEPCASQTQHCGRGEDNKSEIPVEETFLYY